MTEEVISEIRDKIMDLMEEYGHPILAHMRNMNNETNYWQVFKN